MSTFELRRNTLLGEVILRADSQSLTGLWFAGQKHAPTPIESAGSNQMLEHAADLFEQYLQGARPQVPATEPLGTAFQRQVWAALRDIPPGTTQTYGQLAARLGAPSAVRAVAAAVGRNPVSVFVPCHRVLGANGSLTGYAGGLGRKSALLALEAGRPLPWRRIRSGCIPVYADPIRVTVGDRVRWVDRVDDGEFPGWKWAVGESGLQGWLPRSWFGPGQAQSHALRDCSSTELAAASGSEVLPLDQHGGWSWVIDRERNCGWILDTALA